MLIPKENERDIADLDPLARENLRFIPCTKASDVLREALILPEIAKASEPTILTHADRKAPICPKGEVKRPSASLSENGAE